SFATSGGCSDPSAWWRALSSSAYTASALAPSCARNPTSSSRTWVCWSLVVVTSVTGRVDASAARSAGGTCELLAPPEHDASAPTVTTQASPARTNEHADPRESTRRECTADTTFRV